MIPPSKELKAIEILKKHIGHLQEMDVTLSEAIAIAKLEKEAEEAIAELEELIGTLEKMKCCENCISNTYFGSSQYCAHPVEVESRCRQNNYSKWELRQRG